MKKVIKERIEQIRHGNVPDGYKKTKEGIFPCEWDVQTLNKLLEFKNGINADKEKFGQGTKLISVRDILSDYPITYETIQGSVDVNERQIEEFGVKYGDILFQRSSENYEDAGTSNVYLDPNNTAVFSGFVIRGKKTSEYNPVYLNALLRTAYVRKAIIRQAAGAQHINIGQESLAKVRIAIADDSEQKKIAEILTTQDKVIELKEKRLAEKQRQKKYLMQQLLTGKKRLPGFDGKWKFVELGKIAKKEKAKNRSFIYSLVFSNSAQHGVIPQTDQFDKEIASEDRIDGYYIVHDGFFVYNPRISATAPCGPINRNETGTTGVMSPLYTVFSIESKMMNTDFLKQYFSSSCWYKHMKSVANYGARHDRMSVSDDDFFLMPIPVPTQEEQTAIADVLMVADKEIDLLHRELEQEKQKKKALMQLLLTGIVRVNA